MQRWSSKLEAPCESKARGVRFSCSTEENGRRKETSSDGAGLRPVSTALEPLEAPPPTVPPKISLFDLWANADRAGVFANFTAEPNTGCYLWTGRVTKQGYGVVSIERRVITVHRAVYRLCVEEIGDDLDVHHICEQPGCIYPEHLVALTHKQHRRVHAGLAQIRVVFIERKRVDPFDLGMFGVPFGGETLDLANCECEQSTPPAAVAS